MSSAPAAAASVTAGTKACAARLPH
jgi:hypothetical protein